MRKMKKHLTIVYTINNEEAFENERTQLMAKFKCSDGEPWAITAMSIDHEIHRLSLIDEAASAGEHDLIDNLLKTVDVFEYETLDDFRHKHGTMNDE